MQWDSIWGPKSANAANEDPDESKISTLRMCLRATIRKTLHTGTMGRELQKKKNKSSLNKVKRKPRSKKKILNNVIIARNW